MAVRAETNVDRRRAWIAVRASVYRVVCLVLAVVAGCGVALAADVGPTVTTADGPVRGYTKDGIDIFLGIPYAAPPVGDLRWRPPHPASAWKEPRDATHFADNCAQVTAGGPFSGPASVNEDCLYLNVFATSGRSDRKKPVIVWLHGGGNFAGEANDYDGGKLASGGPGGVATVVVTVNYRLGLFGTLSHAALNAEGHPWGNYNILDQQAAFRWVQRNIEAFGGDPSKVAIGGQSAGAYDVGANLASPTGKGLFSRAIMQSSPGFASMFANATTAMDKGMSFAAAAGCPGSDAAAAKCLRELSTARVLQVQGTVVSRGPYIIFTPIVDGTIIPIAPEQAWATGQYNKVPVLGGSTKDEETFFAGAPQYYLGSPPPAMTPAQYAAASAEGAFCLECSNRSVPAGAAALYPLADYGGDPAAANDRLQTDAMKCRELSYLQRFAGQVPTYAYDFTYRNAPFYFPKMPGFKALASHTIDIQFLFSRFHGGPLGVNLDQTTGLPRELNAEESKLSDQLIAAWTNFANTGNPNGSGNAPWPRFTADRVASYLVQDAPLSTKPVSRFRAEYKCDFWDAHSTY